MKIAEFKRGVETAFTSVGFEKAGGLMRRSTSDVAVMIGFEKGFGDQWFINVGFWLKTLGIPELNRIEMSHMNFRLDRLFPELREMILTAGALEDESQRNSYLNLIEAIHGAIGNRLIELDSEAALRAAFEAGHLADGLIRKEAREVLCAAPLL